ncbi:MAG: hypothetical protein LBK99_06495 [Opitutaceae bacterium]|jgi:hypothetical protein|nr:hypothetical protein [Opitutaceae bacterium]
MSKNALKNINWKPLAIGAAVGAAIGIGYISRVPDSLKEALAKLPGATPKEDAATTTTAATPPAGE